MRWVGLARSAIFVGSLAALAPAWADPPAAPVDERRVVWGGLVRGPLSPADALALEKELIEGLGEDERILLVDAAGKPLGHVARTKEMARVDRVMREGLDLVLRGKHDAGRTRIDQAVALFEDSLGAHENHAVLYEALLLQALSLFERGQTEAARSTLARLGALAPDMAPTEPPGLVSLWREARATREKPGRLEITTAGPPAEIRLDGRPLGPTPVIVPKLSAGLHLLGAEWHDATVSQTVQIAPGRPMRVAIERPALGEKARAELLTAASARTGPQAVAGAIPRIATMAGASEVALAVARPDGTVMLARHGADGALLRMAGATGATSFGTPASKSVARRLSATVLIDRPPGGFFVDAGGKENPWPVGPSEAYGGPAPAATDLTPRPDLGPQGAWIAPPPEPETDDTILSRPWFWVLAGGAVAVIALGVILVAQPAPTTTVVDVVFPTRSR